MARTCSICARDDVEIINRDLFAGVPFEQLHEKYGASVGALHRHKSHTKTQLIFAQSESSENTPASVAQRIMELDQCAEKLYRESVKAGDRLNTARALKEMREIVALSARLTGELNNQPQVLHQHIHISPEWAALRSVILNALQPYPEARTALIAALARAQAVTEGDSNA